MASRSRPADWFLACLLSAAAGCGTDVSVFGESGGAGGAGAASATGSGSQATTTGPGSGGGATTTASSAIASSSTGAPMCAPGTGDCDGNAANGCETDLTTDANCGACGVACPCQLGTCAAACDDSLAIDSADPMDAARAIGLCAGVVQATWTQPDGTPAPISPNFDLGHGLLASFGPNVAPREGARMLAISSGTARTPSDPGYMADFNKGYSSNPVAGFPAPSPSCPGIVPGQPFDGIALQLTLTAPANATALSFAINFYTVEWPQWVCSQFDDEALVLLTPTPPGVTNPNITFDSTGMPLDINGGGFLRACSCGGASMCTTGGKSFDCSLGTAPLLGTGFEAGAATGWLETTAPVTGGSTIQIRFAVHDTNDSIGNTTALIDAWKWLGTPNLAIATTPIQTP